MADKSISFLRNASRIPLELKPGSRALTVTISQVSPFNKLRSPADLGTFDDELRQRGIQVEHLLNPEDDLLLAKVAENEVVFLNLVSLPYMLMGAIRNYVGHLGHWKWRSLFADHPKVFFTSFGNPYVLHEMPHLPNLMAAYGNSAVSQRAAVKVWLGEMEVQGDCPVKLPKISIKPLFL
jgi:hypothetical protein